MRPIQLTIKGINSFREEQVIDFAALVSQGLFGIFGPTGSGKSTILDAMTLALFAKLPRSTKNFININETSAYVSFRFSITTTQTEEYLVERSFRYTNNNPANSCRNISGKLMRLNKEEVEILADRPTEVTKECIALLGLTADDFMRTVVLPQGQFSDFLKLKNTDRRSMLQRIFDLGKYGVELTSKIKRAKQKQDVVISGLEGEIKSYSSVTHDTLKSLNQEMDTLCDTITKKTAELEKMQVTYEQAKEIHLLREELKPLKDQNAELTKQTPVILSYKNRLETGNRANRLYPFFQQKESALSHLTLARKQLKESHDILIEYEETLTSSKNKHKELLEKYTTFSETYHDRRQILIKAQDVQERIQVLLEKQKAAEKSANNAKLKLQTLEEKQQQSGEILLKYQQQLDALKEQMDQLHLDSSRRQLLEYGKGQEDNYLKNVEYCEKLSRKLGEQEKEKETLTQQLDKLKIRLSSCHVNCLNILKALQENLSSLQSKYEKTEADINLLQKKKEHFAKEHWANIFRNDLKEGDPCPICGNIHHGASAKNHLDSQNIVEFPEDIPDENTHNYDANITKLQKYLNELAEKIHDTKQMISSLNSTISEMEPYLISAGRFGQESNDSDETTALSEEKSLNACASANAHENSLKTHIVNKERIQNTYALAKQLMNKHLQLSGIITQQEQQLIDSQNEYDAELTKLRKSHEQLVQFQKDHGFLTSVDFPEQENNITYFFTEQLNLYYEQEKQYNKLSEKYSSLQAKRESISKKAQSFHEEMQPLASMHTAQTAELKQILNQLEEEYKAYPANLSITLDCQSELNFLENQQQNWQKQKEKSTSQLDLLEKKYADAKGDYSAKLAVEKNCGEQFTSLSATYDKELAKEHLSGQDDITGLILSEQEQDNLTKQIKEFETKQNKLKEQISYIESKLCSKDATQSEEEWILLEENFKKLTRKLEDLKKNLILMEHKIKQMKLDLKAKQDIEQDLEKANHKKSIIHELEKLFQGNAFIEYVSLTKLEYIAKEASSTLIQVSNGKYSLEINDQTEFVIRDHHNGGMIRPCDTLSGGETFITSLCLALALSSTLQLNGTTPLELFFLDEGFGSLDDELLDVVMDSLEKLQSRKRSIGIISHVESIQCRVPRKLIVTPAEAEKNGSRVRLEFS